MQTNRDRGILILNLLNMVFDLFSFSDTASVVCFVKKKHKEFKKLACLHTEGSKLH